MYLRLVSIDSCKKRKEIRQYRLAIRKALRDDRIARDELTLKVTRVGDDDGAGLLQVI